MGVWSSLRYTYNRGFRIKESCNVPVSRIPMAAAHDAGERGR